jgi:hypothetical protein
VYGYCLGNPVLSADPIGKIGPIVIGVIVGVILLTAEMAHAPTHPGDQGCPSAKQNLSNWHKKGLMQILSGGFRLWPRIIGKGREVLGW